MPENSFCVWRAFAHRDTKKCEKYFAMIPKQKYRFLKSSKAFPIVLSVSDLVNVPIPLIIFTMQPQPKDMPWNTKYLWSVVWRCAEAQERTTTMTMAWFFHHALSSYLALMLVNIQVDDHSHVCGHS